MSCSGQFPTLPAAEGADQGLPFTRNRLSGLIEHEILNEESKPRETKRQERDQIYKILRLMRSSLNKTQA